jgi:hypothetical protein
MTRCPRASCIQRATPYAVRAVSVERPTTAQVAGVVRTLRMTAGSEMLPDVIGVITAQ